MPIRVKLTLPKTSSPWVFTSREGHLTSDPRRAPKFRDDGPLSRKDGVTLLTRGAASGELDYPAGGTSPPFIEAGIGADQWAPEAAGK